MRPIIASIAAAALVSGAFATSLILPATPAEARESSTCYDGWYSAYDWVEMDVCRYTGGSKSGFKVLRNNTNSTIKVCWKLHYDDTRPTSGCNLGLKPGQTTKTSCSACHPARGGPAVRIEWTRLELAN